MTTAVPTPPLYCPMEPAIHPEADLIEKRAVEWIDRYLRPDAATRARLVDSRSAEFFARCAPHGSTAEVETPGSRDRGAGRR